MCTWTDKWLVFKLLGDPMTGIYRVADCPAET